MPLNLITQGHKQWCQSTRDDDISIIHRFGGITSIQLHYQLDDVTVNDLEQTTSLYISSNTAVATADVATRL